MSTTTSILSPQRILWLPLLAACAVCLSALSAQALVVENMTDTTVAPTDDPGWNYVSNGGRNFVYLGDGWALSAFHVGVPIPTETLNFNGSAFNVVTNQAFTVKNQPGQGLTTDTDLRLVRINGDPGLAPINIASQQLTTSTPMSQREVVIIGNGRTRLPTQTQWNVTQNSGSNNDQWTEATSGTYKGYWTQNPNDNTKRWGKNQIADEDPLFGGSDSDLRGNLQLTLGVGQRDIQTMVTQFDMNGLTNEAQAVDGDSGSSVFYKRNGVWELIGIVNAQHTGIRVGGQFLDNQNNTSAVYGNYTMFADLTYYRNQILSVMNANPNYSVVGDVNLDGVISGSIVSGVPTGDLAAFVAGWGYNNGTGLGTITSWKNGDLNRDGKTDISDFQLIRPLFNQAGSGTLSLDTLFGGAAVPEPASLALLLVGTTFFACSRRRPRR